MSGFTLHHKLATDTHTVGDLGLSRVLLMDDARFPWLILVPRQPSLTEIHQLSTTQRALLTEETALLAAAMQRNLDAQKMNVAALGNLVPQLHIHIVARHHTDAAWPGPVWGVGIAEPYLPEALNARLAQAQSWLTCIH